MSRALTYSIVTPARNEAANLSRLAASIERQTVLPRAWIVVDNGSTDDTLARAEELARRHEWVRVTSAPGEREAIRGGPVARAFTAGLAELPGPADIVVKLDADVSFERDHFERLLRHFADDSALGLASGTCYELVAGSWHPAFVSRGHVRGAVRAYRWECLEDVLPLEERMGWDGIDEIKAAIRGWKAAGFTDPPFYHHRRVGERDGRRRTWIAQGDLAHHLGYRLSYLLIKTAFRVRREPMAVAMLWGYLGALIRRQPRYRDPGVREYLRRQQRLRELPTRMREATGSQDPVRSAR